MTLTTTDDTALALTLGVPGFTWRDLHDPVRLSELTERFHSFAEERANPAAWKLFVRYRENAGKGMAPEEISEALVSIAPHLGAFLAILFGIDEDRARAIEAAEREDVIHAFKRDFVRKRPAKRAKADIEALDAAARSGLDAIARDVLAATSGFEDDVWDDEREVAQTVLSLLTREELFRKATASGGVRASDSDRQDAAIFARKLAARSHLAPMLGAIGVVVTDATTSIGDADAARVFGAALDAIDVWCAIRMHDPHFSPRWLSLHMPAPLDFEHLVPLRRLDPSVPELIAGPQDRLRHREGFALTDPRPAQREIFDQADYCIYCHDRDKDSCSKGFRDKHSGAYKPNPLGIALTGCPLDQRISESNQLKKSGASIAALAVVMVDNPMCPGTGHRICNDCMKACIYQKQEPVDVPSIETSILTDVLSMRWGFELYDLLTRWNPLRVGRPHPLPYNGKNVLVVGLGPAGYTLALHLLNEGFGVVGIDGLKIEPLPSESADVPIERWFDHQRSLEDRVLLGFGGVSEYGITVRWDKNFLAVIYTALARRAHFKVYGGVRFGGTIEVDDAWRLGFDHIAIAGGAGKPTLIDMPNGLARGIRQASDFLMALQLTGAFKKSSLANLPVRLPGVVIGGGLTAIDAATEMRAYYVAQCDKALQRFETLAGEIGAENVMRMFDAEEREVFEESLAHGRDIRDERERAANEKREPDFHRLIESWGGVTIAYRRALVDSPAYRLNHEEVSKCLEEGVRILERAAPREARVDEHGAVCAIRFVRMTTRDGTILPADDTFELPARTVLIAAGTSPNVTYEREHPGTFEMDPETRAFRSFAARVADDGAVTLEPDPEGFFTSYVRENRVVSYYGDNHPAYAGSVVKAMASAKNGYRSVAQLFAHETARLRIEDQAERERAWQAFAAKLDDQLVARVVRVMRLTPNIVEVIARAPMAGRNFRPGQFFRLQNFESHAQEIEGTRLTMEGLALTGASTDPEHGLVSLIVLEIGASSRLCAALSPGEPIVVMGPTGTPTVIPKREHVILAGGGLGNAVLFSIGKALRANGCKVLYFAAYRKPEDIYKMDEIEACADQVVWSVDHEPTPAPRRPQDRAVVGNIVQAMTLHAQGALGERLFDWLKASRLIVIGSDKMMAAVQEARQTVLEPYLHPELVAIASINSPMQCMMKEICAQCLQRQVDPVTGEATMVFSCSNQDQPLDSVDFAFLDARLRQASVQEKLANLWLHRLLKVRNVLRV